MKNLIVLVGIFLSILTACGGGGGGNRGSGGSGKPKTPPVQKLATFSLGQISAGGGHSCALTAAGNVLCWGKGDSGQLGYGGTSNLLHPDLTSPVEDSDGEPLTGILQVESGETHACALTEEGEVLCWGNGADGRLGNDCGSSCTDQDQAVTVVNRSGSGPLAGIVQIDVGESHVCALSHRGEVLCWGSNQYGQLGNGRSGNNKSKDSPMVVLKSSSTGSAPLTGIVQIATGKEHTCALTAKGDVLCWGNGADGRLGNGNAGVFAYPQDVLVEDDGRVLTSIAQISAGGGHTCAVSKSGGVLCWGDGGSGQLGNDERNDQDYPVNVASGDGSVEPLINIVQVSAGNEHTCALSKEKSAICWGDTEDGRLGNENSLVCRDGDEDPLPCKDHPVGVVSGENSPFILNGISQISAGSRHTCALTDEGGVRCWGYGDSGRLGNNAITEKISPVAVVSDTSNAPLYVELWRREYDCYDDGTCGINRDFLTRPILVGARSGTDSTPEVRVLGLEEGETITLHEDANCSGSGIGSGTVSEGEDSVTITVEEPGLTAKKNSIYAKIGNECITNRADYVLTNGVSRISGKKRYDDHTPALTVKLLAIGDKISFHANPDCSGTPLARATARGTGHVLPLTTGLEKHGRHVLYLKQNDICHPHGFKYELVHIGKLPRVGGGWEGLIGEKGHTCVVTSGGGVKCWGGGAFGKLGNNGTTNKDHPVDVVTSGTNSNPLAGIVQVSAGSRHTCALTSGGGVKCWGWDGYGRLGNDCNDNCLLIDKDDEDNNGTDYSYPVDVVASNGSTDLLGGIVQISSGSVHTCAVVSAYGYVKCWGANATGVLGTGDAVSRDHPVDVQKSGVAGTLNGVIQVSSGSYHVCALTQTGEVWCWGGNQYGGLGNGESTGISPGTHYPVKVKTSRNDPDPLGNIVQVSTGAFYSCALTASSRVKCWGGGAFGKLGNGGTTASSYPVDVVTSGTNSGPLTDIVQIDGYGQHVCATTSGGGVKCWGRNNSGQLGNGGSTDKEHPVDVATSGTDSNPLAAIVEVSADGFHSCALTATGEVKCWGRGDDGRLGNDCEPVNEGDPACADESYPVTVIDGDGSSTALNVGTSTTTHYICGDLRCVRGSE